MKVKRLTFKTIPEDLRDTEKWTKIDVMALSDEDRARVERLMPAVTAYLQNGKLSAAARSAKLGNDALLDQVNRCLTALEDGGVLGWAGLLPYLRIRPYIRTAALPEGAGASNKGSSGAFQRFLREHPKIKTALDEAIRKGIGKGDARAAHTSPKSVWGLFVKLAKAAVNDDATKYPLNQKKCAQATILRYVRHMVATDAKARHTAVGEAALAMCHVGTGKFSFDLVDADQDLMGIDAHHIDCVGSIEVEGPAGPQWIALERIWIYVVICMKSRAVHGYSASIRTEPVAEQIEIALDMAGKPWTPREIRMPGVRYKEGAGFPMGSVDGLEVFAPSALRMDSAMQSFSNRVVKRIRRRFGCALSWSAIGAWWHNDMVERLFGTLERTGIHQLATSVGSGPKDPKKTDGAAEAIRLKVTWEELLDLIDIAIANYNSKAQPGLGHRSPLEVLRATYTGDGQRWVPRPVMPPTMLTPRLGVAIERAVVRGSCKAGRMRHPYIQLDKATYANAELASSFDLIGKTVLVHVHEDDMRKVEVYLENGTYLGWMEVQSKGWRKTKHSRDVRKMINRLRDARELAEASDDYVADYLNYLAAKVLADARERPKNVSQTATELANTLRTTGVVLAKVRAPRPADVQAPRRPVPLLLNLPKPWA